VEPRCQAASLRRAACRTRDGCTRLFCSVPAALALRSCCLWAWWFNNAFPGTLERVYRAGPASFPGVSRPEKYWESPE